MSVDGVVGPWPSEFPVLSDGDVEVGLVVWSLSGEIEGRTTGNRRPCTADGPPGVGCPGWFIGVTWETGQRMAICSKGWHYDPVSRSVRITDGGEISARFRSPKPLGEPPLPCEEWLDRSKLMGRAGWKHGTVT
jgi:hypothetical protein